MSTKTTVILHDEMRLIVSEYVYAFIDSYSIIFQEIESVLSTILSIFYNNIQLCIAI